MVDIVKEFNKLKQLGNVEMYQKRFEELRSYMIQHKPYLTEVYFMSSYLSGLNDEANGEGAETPNRGPSIGGRPVTGVGSRSLDEEAKVADKGDGGRNLKWRWEAF